MTDYARKVRPERQSWRESMRPECMYCYRAEYGGTWLEVHEIERKSQAAGRWGERCNYLLLCPSCHATHFASMPHARQLAVKLINDPKHFCLASWLRIKDPELKAPERVTLEDVVAHVVLELTEED